MNKILKLVLLLVLLFPVAVKASNYSFEDLNIDVQLNDKKIRIEQKMKLKIDSNNYQINFSINRALNSKFKSYKKQLINIKDIYSNMCFSTLDVEKRTIITLYKCDKSVFNQYENINLSYSYNIKNRYSNQDYIYLDIFSSDVKVKVKNLDYKVTVPYIPNNKSVIVIDGRNNAYFSGRSDISENYKNLELKKIVLKLNDNKSFINLINIHIIDIVLIAISIITLLLYHFYKTNRIILGGIVVVYLLNVINVIIGYFNFSFLVLLFIPLIVLLLLLNLDVFELNKIEKNIYTGLLLLTPLIILYYLIRLDSYYIYTYFLAIIILLLLTIMLLKKKT